ncbi:class I SAM-dependent methyltransferase [Flavobacterium amniphilum]|uniref:class I SAM-dependent methyltransferase n=1 Tax=Flavobacterium amniphilum TaxID=1834035 RepID=UPI002029CFEA|nr:class I SAM-dependent methyltransferase [Flavobacterium amniphilum]MCL9804383.1 class I SAM-dependent methyltransferase [Flavobacterium amniphilum]
MNDYRQLFQSRANDYHFAMQKYPDARNNEFNSLLSSIDFSNVREALDVPSGGGYLKRYIPSHVNLKSVDFSEGFINDSIALVSPKKLPFESSTFDVVFSLSGMHHLENVPLFVEECLRIIKDDGRFVFADVEKDSSVDNFLNKFVNEHNSLGHDGNFFFKDYFLENPDIQSKIIDCQFNKYPFVFNNTNEMIHFFKLFFGLDKASEAIVLEGVQDILGVVETNNGIEVNWGLIQYQLKK